MASKRAELLAETPIIPNTNVGSKLKEILAMENENKAKEKREKPKGKWDDIMNRIAEGKQKRPEKPKEVKSKVFADFKPPKLIRPPSQKIRANASNSSSSSNGFLEPRKMSRQSSSVASRSTR